MAPARVERPPVTGARSLGFNGAIAGPFGCGFLWHALIHRNDNWGEPVMLYRYLGLALSIATGLAPAVGWAALPAHSGDINQDHLVNVMDLSCYIALAMSDTSAGGDLLCAVQSLDEADADCSGDIDILDVQLVALRSLYLVSKNSELQIGLYQSDADLDFVVNACEAPPPVEPICELSGAAGDEVICPIRVARDLGDSQGPPYLDFRLLWASAAVEWMRFEGWQLVSPGQPLELAPTPPYPLHPAGHQVVVVSEPPAGAPTGPGEVVAKVAYQLDFSSISEATWSATGGEVGNASVVNARFRLVATISAAAPAVVKLELSTTPYSMQNTYPLRFEGDLVVSSEGCLDTSGACPAGPACSIGTCIGGECIHTPIECTSPDACSKAYCSSSWGCKLVAVQCDDGLECTVDACDPVSGCVHEPVTVGTTCGAGPCQLAGACQADGVCAGASALPLDDGDPCTNDFCDPEVGAVHQPKLCNGWAACAVGTCVGGDCEYALDDAWCDDGDPATVDLCLPGHPESAYEIGCVSLITDDPKCPTGYQICEVEAFEPPGEWAPLQEDYASCAVQFVSDSEACDSPDCVPTAAQMQLLFDPERLHLAGVVDAYCYDGFGCYDVPVSLVADGPSQPLSTGHLVAVTPDELEKWNETGFGAFVLVNLPVPGAPLTLAATTAGGIEGDPVLYRALFQPGPGWISGESATVCIEDVIVAGAESDSLALSQPNGANTPIYVGNIEE